MRVEDVMTKRAETCGLEDPLNRAAQIMWENDCGCVPVVDDAGRAVAMLTDRDICMAAYTQGKPLSEMPVSSAASRSLYAVRATDAIATAEAMMRKHKIRRLPVVDEADRPVGMLSMNDLARHAQDAPRRASELSADVLVRTLAAVCEPHEREAMAAE